MSTIDRVRALVAPIVVDAGLDLYDLELGGVLRVAVDRPGGVALDEVAAATRAISRALDEVDPIAGAYTLEVTTPGLERPLRTAEHFAAAVGERVKVKLRPGVEGDRRVAGTLGAVHDGGIRIDLDGGGDRRVELEEIDRARTVFVWGPAAKEERAR